MKNYYILLFLCFSTPLFSQQIPLPEHPRPDFERANWLNLNGSWDFEFDSLDVGVAAQWQNGKTAFSKKINVPFPWGAPLSGVKDEADFAWYKRSITVPKSWAKQRIFVTIGASDWETSVWLNGVFVQRCSSGQHGLLVRQLRVCQPRAAPGGVLNRHAC